MNGHDPGIVATCSYIVPTGLSDLANVAEVVAAFVDFAFELDDILLFEPRKDPTELFDDHYPRALGAAGLPGEIDRSAGGIRELSAPGRRQRLLAGQHEDEATPLGGRTFEPADQH